MQNKAFVNKEGYIELVVAGDQNYDTVNRLYLQAKPLIERFQIQGEPLLGLVNMEQEGKFSNDTHKAALEFLEKVDYTRLAMYGAPVGEIASLIVLALGKSSNTKVFDTRQEAVKWLTASPAN